MMRRATIFLLFAATALFVAPYAQAQSYRTSVRYTNCTDPTGTRVIQIMNPRLRNVGLAGRVRGRPVIFLNPRVLRRFRPITRTFWFYHECAHHALGHSLGHRPISRERDADCWAIRQIKRRGMLTAARLRTIQRDLYPLRGDGVLYLPGPQRAAYVGYCATGRNRPVIAQNARRRYLKPSGGTGSNTRYYAPRRAGRTARVARRYGRVRPPGGSGMTR